MDSYQVEHYGVPFAESNVADNTESMKFSNKPSKKLEYSKFGLKEKFNVNNLDEFDTVAINKMEETKKTEPSTNKTTKSQIFVQKSNDVVRQDVGRSESSIGFSNWSKAAYSIQVGAFLNKDNAIKMATILEKKGYSANIVKFNDAKGRVWHTVRIGKYASWRAANKHAKDFSSKQRLDSIVRPIGRF
jgi:septal ring-binding cell division protein DamX